MPRLAATPITLTTEEQMALEKIARRSSTAQQIARRATIVLRAAQGASHGEIARELGMTKDTTPGSLISKEVSQIRTLSD